MDDATRSNMAANYGGTFRDMCTSTRLLMPTHKPRLQITLEPDVRAILDRLATLQKRPASKIVAEILEEAHPVLHQIADTLDAINEASESVKGTIRRRLSTAERRAYSAAVEGMSILAELEQDARSIERQNAGPPGMAAQRAPRGAGSSRPLPPNPRPSNTGVTPPGMGKKRR